jgi:hypothetical protein
MSTETEKIAVSPLPAADRMRHHRERRRLGLRCVMIQLRETEVDNLNPNGFLRPGARNDPYAVQMALYAFFDRTLGAIS